MSDDFDSIRIFRDMMLELRGLALERAVTVSDIVHEALGEYLLARTNSINYFDVIHGIENELRRAEDDQFVTNVDPAGLAIFIKSPIRHVYRPELRYEFRAVRNDMTSVGKLGVVLRSHDMDMIRQFSAFVGLWTELEGKYLPRTRTGQITYIIDAGYFGRQIYLPETAEQNDGQTIGDAISSYIRIFDDLLKRFISRHGGSKEIETLYLAGLNDGKLTI
jgi:hypothetical protein